MHRSRLFAQHLPTFGWEPVILTVHEEYYEEKLDHNLEALLPVGLRIEKVKAFRTTRPRLIGDIGIRGFFQLYKKAKALIKNEGFDFLYIPIPSFYPALLGRWLHHSTGIKYGIDYIDPWVHHFPGSEKIFSRHWFSTKMAKFLEPVAIKKASLITGVAEGYYKGVIDRNPLLNRSCVFGAMPYGGEETDHIKVKAAGISSYLFNKVPGKIQLIYAGAMLPKAYKPLEAAFKSIQKNPGAFSDLEIHFIGTGSTPNDPNGYNIKALAEEYGIWHSIIFEHPARIPYMDVLVHLNAADGIFILGSTEPHYTPSKVYQGVLSVKPIFTVLHKKSTAVKIVKDSGAGVVLEFDGENDLDEIEHRFTPELRKYIDNLPAFDGNKINYKMLEQYSARNVTSQLATLLNSATSDRPEFKTKLTYDM